MIYKSKLSILIFIAVLLITLVFCSSQTVFAEGAKYIIRAAFQDPPDPMKQVTATFWTVFKDRIEAFTGGEVEVQLFPSGQLGDAQANYRAVKAGEIEMTNAGAGTLGSALYPQITMFELPYLFPDNMLAIDVLTLETPFIRELVEGLKKETGIRTIAIYTQGFRHLTNNVRPIKTPYDLKGLKIRTQQIPAHMKMIEATGAHSVPIAFTELYTSLQTGVVDGEENPLFNIVAQHMHEVQKYLTLSSHVINCVMAICNDNWFESLPNDIQSKIMKAAEAAVVSSEGLTQVLDVVFLETIKEAGVEIYVPSPEELLEFKKVMQPDALESFRSEVKGGAELLSMLEKEIEKAEQRYENLVY